MVTFVHHLPNNLGQLHEDGSADRGLAVTFPPGVSLSSQYNSAICTHIHKKKQYIFIQLKSGQKSNVTADSERGEGNVVATGINESFDDSKHVADHLGYQDVVDLNRDILLAAQSVDH